MKYILIILIFISQNLIGQTNAISFTNRDSIYNELGFDSKIHEIILNPDSTFEFWSRPQISCFSWVEYNGQWEKLNDTIYFYDRYEINEKPIEYIYQKQPKREFYELKFFTDSGSELKNRLVDIEFVYDFGSNLSDVKKKMRLNSDNEIKIPFAQIPNHSKLASIGIEYYLDEKRKRIGYITENKFANVRMVEVPNMVTIQFKENPQKEIIERTNIGVISGDTLTIISSFKTKSILPDYHRKLIFKANYKLAKK